MKNATDFEMEKALLEEGRSFVIGIDEAGRGPLAGPVVAAAVCYKQRDFAIPEHLEKEFLRIRDSKKLSPKQREEMSSFIEEHFYVGIGVASNEVIDRLNILQATFLAMKGAYTILRKQLPREERTESVVLVDGNQLIPNVSFEQKAVVGGDGFVKSIAAASIMAKVAHDRFFASFEEQYPGYGFGQHMGYGTKVHMDALRRLGPSPVHRMTFRPVELSIPENANRKFSRVLRPRRP